MFSPELTFLDEKRRAKRLGRRHSGTMPGMTFHALADQTRTCRQYHQNIAHDLIEELDRTVRYETPVIMGIDEVSIAGKYRCVITNLATNNVFQMLEFRTQDHLKPFFKNLPDRERVEWVCTDMWRPVQTFILPVPAQCRLVIDKFHVVKWHPKRWKKNAKYQATFEQGRAHPCEEVDSLAHAKRPGNPECKLKALAVVRQAIPRIGQSLRFKEAFFPHLRRPDKASAQHAFEAWENTPT